MGSSKSAIYAGTRNPDGGEEFRRMAYKASAGTRRNFKRILLANVMAVKEGKSGCSGCRPAKVNYASPF